MCAFRQKNIKVQCYPQASPRSHTRCADALGSGDATGSGDPMGSGDMGCGLRRRRLCDLVRWCARSVRPATLAQRCAVWALVPEALVRPVIAETVQLPKICGTLARHGSRTVSPCEPAQLRSCPKVTRIANSCSESRDSAQIRPLWQLLAKSWPSSADSGQTWPMLATRRPKLAGFGRCWPPFGHFGDRSP